MFTKFSASARSSSTTYPQFLSASYPYQQKSFPQLCGANEINSWFGYCHLHAVAAVRNKSCNSCDSCIRGEQCRLTHFNFDAEKPTVFMLESGRCGVESRPLWYDFGVEKQHFWCGRQGLSVWKTSRFDVEKQPLLCGKPGRLSVEKPSRVCGKSTVVALAGLPKA